MTKARERGRGGGRKKERCCNWRARSCAAKPRLDRSTLDKFILPRRQERQQRAGLLSSPWSFGKAARCFMARTAAVVTFVDVELSLTSSRIVRGGGSRARRCSSSTIGGKSSRIHGTAETSTCSLRTLGSQARDNVKRHFP